MKFCTKCFLRFENGNYCGKCGFFLSEFPSSRDTAAGTFDALLTKHDDKIVFLKSAKPLFITEFKEIFDKFTENKLTLVQTKNELKSIYEFCVDKVASLYAYETLIDELKDKIDETSRENVIYMFKKYGDILLKLIQIHDNLDKYGSSEKKHVTEEFEYLNSQLEEVLKEKELLKR